MVAITFEPAPGFAVASKLVPNVAVASKPAIAKIWLVILFFSWIRS
jgi:hypothetical protein